MLLVIVTAPFLGWTAAAAYDEVQVSNPGRIEVEVKVAGEVPKLPAQEVFKHQEHCGKTIADERLIVGPAAELQNAIVSLAGVKAGKAIDRAHDVALDNRRCAFVPHVLTASIGQSLAIHNGDPFVHDAHAWLGTRTLFNRGIVKDHTVRERLDDPGLVHINCNVRHTWMHAYVYVSDNPYHGVTGANGRLVLEDVPPGRYTLSVWHEMLGDAEREVSVSAGQTSSLKIELTAEAKETAAP
jgi:plastocyanin